MYIDRKNLPPQLQPLCTTAMRVDAAESFTMHADAGTWSGGTREIVGAVDLSDGRAVSITDTLSAPWSADRTTREIALKPGFGIIVTGHFCGKPSTPHLYVHPQDLTPMLPPPPPALTKPEALVLHACSHYKSAYRQPFYREHRLDPGAATEAAYALMQKGLLNKQGAITSDGRNTAAAIKYPGYGEFVWPQPQ